VTLVRDRLTWLIYIRTAAWGWFIFGFGAFQPLLREAQGTSGAVAGLHGTALALGVISAGITNAYVAHRFGPMGGTNIALGIFSVGIVILSFAGPVQFTLIAAMICGYGGSTALNLLQPVLLAHHDGPAAEQAFSEGNGLGGLLGAACVGLIGFFATNEGPWRLVLLITIGWLIFARLGFGNGGAGTHQPAPGGREQGALGRTYWIRWVGVVAMIGTEFALSFWVAALIAERTGLKLGSSTVIVMVFAGGVGIGRLLGGRLVHRFSTDRLLLGAIALTLVSFFSLWLSTSPVVAFFSLFATGLGLALFYPLGIVRALAAAPDRPALVFGRMGLAGVAIAVAPFLLGWLSDEFGVVKAYLIVPVLLIVAGAVVLISPMRTSHLKGLGS
jgi:MFS family permease